MIAAALCRDSLGAQESELARQISQRRAAIRAGSDGGDRSPIAALERRKYETPASVIVLEALSQVLPDHTYVTELHLAGNKLQIVGITRDAPSLIPLIEQSQHFTRATFYAPTTRSPSDPGERFHIEARIEPKNTVEPMNAMSRDAITRTLTHSPLIAVVLYVAVLGGLLAIAGFAVADILDHQRALAQTSDLLDQLQGRKAARRRRRLRPSIRARRSWRDRR